MLRRRSLEGLALVHSASDNHLVLGVEDSLVELLLRTFVGLVLASGGLDGEFHSMIVMALSVPI
jgi:hypothetical protein